MVGKQTTDLSDKRYKLELINRIKIALRFSVNTIRRTVFHPIILLWSVIILSVFVIAIFKFDVLLEDFTNKSGLFQNLVLITAALLALPLALSRTLTSERTLLNDRYQKASEMLGSEIITVRLAAVYALERLSKERSEDYHVDIVKLIGFFVRMRTPTLDDSEDPPRGKQISVGAIPTAILDDVQAALTYLKDRDDFLRHIEQSEGLKQIDLSHSNLTSYNLSTGKLHHTIFDAANLTDADLSGTCLTGCSLNGARVNNTNLASVTGLRQQTLDEAIADEVSPPRLGTGDQVPVDPDTKQKLVWTK